MGSMHLLVILVLLQGQILCQEEDRGLIVSLLPHDMSFNNGELVTFPGRVDNFAKQQDGVDSRYYYFIDETDVLSMACDPRENVVYLLDGVTQSLYKVKNFDVWLNDTNRNVTLLHQGISYASSVQIAYDWLSKNIYWTDELYNWIAVQPADTTDKTMFKVIVHDNLKKPSAVTVDPIKGYLFWSEQSLNHVIERSALTGEDRKVIITGVSWVPDMIVDTQEEKIYWVDIGRNSLESAKYDGSGRRLIRRSTNVYLYMNGVTLYKDVVCISQYQLGTIECLDKNSGAVVWGYNFGYQQPWAVEVYDKDLQRLVSHPCEGFACEHFCVNTPGGAKCLCKEGYELSTDMKTCQTRHNLYGKGLIIANGTDLCMLDIRVITTHMSEPRCFFRWKSNITHLAVDSNQNFVFFTDDSSKHITRLDIAANTTSTITAFDNTSGFAYDWINHDVYWAESGLGKIRAASTDGTMLLETDIYWDVKNPTYLTIDPHNFTLFWISSESGTYKIEGGTMDGLSRWTVISSPVLDSPTGLVFDVSYNWLFWINRGEMRSIRSDGTGMLTYHTVGSKSDTLLYKDYALATNGQEEISVSNLHSTSKSPDFSIDIKDFGTVSDMSVFDPTVQRLEKGPCEENGGGCEHLCIPESSSKYSCRCVFGFRLSSDLHNCSSTSLRRDFAMVVDFTHGLIYQVSLDNASVVAIDIPFPNFPRHAIYNPRHKDIYWTDFKDKQIVRASIDGGKKAVVYNAGLYMPSGLAQDPSTGNLYYSASTLNDMMTIESYIGVLNPYSGQHKVVISKLVHVSQIAIHPQKGWIFWIDIGNVWTPGYIGRGSMDGEDRIYFVSTDLGHPASLAVDFIGERLYWSDSQLNTINSIDLDGNNRRVLMHDPNADIAQIAIAGSHVFYTATNRQFITKINKETGTVASWMNAVPEFGRLESVGVYTGDRVPVNSNCSVNNGLCSTFCLPTPTGRTCACEDGKSLLGDKRTCEGVKRCPDSIPNGRLSPTCSGYLGASCSFRCYSGYVPVSTRHVHCTADGSWDRDIDKLCQKRMIDPETSAQKMSGDTGMGTGAIIGVVIAILVGVAIIVVVCLLMYRRRTGMFAHAKFVNAPNVQLNPSSAENVYSNNEDKDTFRSIDFNQANFSSSSNPTYGNGLDSSGSQSYS